MFTVKVTYCGHTRKVVFPEATTFPSYEDICSELIRVFPLITRSFYFSKVLFSPTAERSSRILVTREVRSADDYVKVTRQFRHRHWSNALLRFEVIDTSVNSTRTNAGASATSRHAPVSHRTESRRSQSSMSRPSIRSTTQTESSVLSTATETETPMVVDEPVPNVASSARRNDKAPAQHQRPLPQHKSSASARSPRDTSQETAELREILGQFQSVIDRTMAQITPVSSPSNAQNRNSSSSNEGTSEFIKTMADAPPPSLCSICTRHIGASQDRQSDWYSCANCHVVICGDCHKTDRPGFCLSTMGSHNMELAAMSSGRVRDLPIPHLPAPWTARPSLSPLTIPTAATTMSEGRTITTRNGPTVTTTRGPITTTTIGPNGTTTVTTITESSTANLAETVDRPAASIMHVMCDSCQTIISEGIRHKCLECPDYDLCSACIGKGAAEEHNPFHEFFDITEPSIVHTMFSGEGERETPRAPERTLTPPAPAPAEVHRNPIHPATCDLCESRIVGCRYKCAVCPDFDTCNGCFSIVSEQHPGHTFIRIQKPDDFVRARAQPRQMHYATCDGCNRTIQGTRYKCMSPDCLDYDLCENCEALPIPVHPSFHPMLKMKTADTVIPTVSRFGRRVLIPELSAITPESAPSPPKRDSVNLSAEPVSSAPPVPPKPVEAIPATSSPVAPAPQAAKPPLPPKPEMISRGYEASIPRFYFYKDGNLDSEPSVSNPFADIPMLETPSAPTFPQSYNIPMPAMPAVEGLQAPLEPTIVLPSVPSHPPNPWPTTNPTVGRELREKIEASFTASLDRQVSNDKPRALPLPPPPMTMLGCQIPVNAMLAHNAGVSGQTATAAVDPNTAKKDSEREPGTAHYTGASFGDFRMSHLLEGLEERIASLKDHNVSSSQKSPAAVSDGSISREPLVNRRPSWDEIAADIRDLVKDLPSLVPTKEAVENTFKADLRSLTDLVNDLPSLASLTRTVEPPLMQKQEQEQMLSAAFLEDVTVPDGQVFPPGAEFMKCWRLKNDSKRDWPASTELVLVAGTGLAASSPVEIGPVAAGAEIHAWTGELKAPDAPGRYVSYWRLRADGEKLFGNSLWIDINVVESDIHHSSDDSMAASSIIMPTMSSPRAGEEASQLGETASTTVKSVSSTHISVTSTEDNISDAGSDISLISLPSSPSDDEDEMLWHDSRSQTTAERAQAAATAAASRRPASSTQGSAMDYVLLYDDSSSSEEM
ncbi:hypothetical protein CPC08DRAFT_746636 [Agrocybe pediades]|nr:hypothetical protein CPC08DRAFT_746636 [Agrocybe pediades]